MKKQKDFSFWLKKDRDNTKFPIFIFLKDLSKIMSNVVYNQINAEFASPSPPIIFPPTLSKRMCMTWLTYLKKGRFSLQLQV